jgi:hypothetical protein
MCCDLMSTDSPDVEDTSDMNEESVSVPTTNDVGLVCLGDTMLFVFLEILL